MAGNAKLGWATAGAIAWAYLGLLAALGPGVRDGLPPLDMQLGHPPGSIVIPGRLLALKEHGGRLELRIGTPDGQPTPVKLVPLGPDGRPLRQGQEKRPMDQPPGDGQELPAPLEGPRPASLPPDVQVEFVADPGREARKPEMHIESGEHPFRLPGGGAGVMAGNYLVHVTPGEVRLIPREVIGEKLRERMRDRRDQRRGAGRDGEAENRRQPGDRQDQRPLMEPGRPPDGPPKGPPPSEDQGE